MAFAISNQPKNNFSRLQNILFYLALVCLIAVGASYGFFALKMSLANRQMAVLQTKLMTYGTPEQKAEEQTLLGYKKDIDNFSLLVNNHRNSLNLFNFMETNTLPNVWYSSFNVSELDDQLSLAGEADNMDTLSHQVQIFENNQDYINGISVLSSQSEQDGNIGFSLKLSLNPTIFLSYVPPISSVPVTVSQAPATPPATTGDNSVPVTPSQ